VNSSVPSRNRGYSGSFLWEPRYSSPDGLERWRERFHDIRVSISLRNHTTLTSYDGTGFTPQRLLSTLSGAYHDVSACELGPARVDPTSAATEAREEASMSAVYHLDRTGERLKPWGRDRASAPSRHLPFDERETLSGCKACERVVVRTPGGRWDRLRSAVLCFRR
jgi:hypothetical protein